MNNRWNDDYNQSDIKRKQLEDLLDDAFPQYANEPTQITVDGAEGIEVQLSQNFNKSVSDSIDYGMALVLAHMMDLNFKPKANMDDVMDLVFAFFDEHEGVEDMVDVILDGFNKK